MNTEDTAKLARDAMASFRVGQMVQSLVWIGHECRPMGSGCVVAVHSGYCDVDMCYPYGAPWIVGHHNTHLRALPNDKVQP